MKSVIGILSAFVVIIMAGSAMALSLSNVVSGVNITKYDGEQGAGIWYGTAEDQEVEVGMQTGQIWDMEAIFWDASKSTLFMVAGFDFKDGQGGFDAGDVFLFGNTYDYVIDLGRVGDAYSNLSISAGGKGTFDLYGATSLHTLSVYYPQNVVPSDPYAHSGTSDTLIPGGIGIEYAFYEGLDDGYGLTGGTGQHYVLAFNLAGIPINLSGLEVHMTMECGNDVMKGDVPPVPEPATLLLLGSGLIGLAGFGRKLKKA